MQIFLLFLWNADIDECNEETPCDLNAVCVNFDGSFNCSCMEGYTGNGTLCDGKSFTLS